MGERVLTWNTDINLSDETHRGTQHERKRQLILQVAARAFNERGFYQTSLTYLAEKLNVTKPALYYYVKSKDEILDGILSAAVERMREIMHTAAEMDADGISRLEWFAPQFAEYMSSDFGACLILMRTNALEERFRKPYHELSAEVFASVQEMIRAGIADGSIAPCEPKFMASILLGSLNETVYWHQVMGRRSPADSAAHILTALKIGLSPR